MHLNCEIAYKGEEDRLRQEVKQAGERFVSNSRHTCGLEHGQALEKNVVVHYQDQARHMPF